MDSDDDDVEDQHDEDNEGENRRSGKKCRFV